jgi:hypothetical protein
MFSIAHVQYTASSGVMFRAATSGVLVAVAADVDQVLGA